MKTYNPVAFRPGPVTFWTTLVYLLIAIPLIWVHETVPSAPGPRSLHRGLNLTEALHDLQSISSAYHPFNSRQNDVVRSYLLARVNRILENNQASFDTVHFGGHGGKTSETHANDWSAVATTTKDATIFDDEEANVTWTYDDSKSLGARLGPSHWSGHYFEGNNIYVYVRGKEDPQGSWWETESDYNKAHAKGGVLVNCHFDSVSTGFGATDDGVACVSMLQLLSYFTTENRQPRNGIVLLFNNAEEDGLLGARAFGNSPLLEFCHTFVNLEGAGAGGRALLFRTTDLQAAQAYSKTPHPFGTVIAGDAFKRGLIRSGTDYQVFYENFGQRGIDVAFYAPRARYHTEEDDARHTSVASIWHMLSAAIASTESFAATTGTAFYGSRADGDSQLPQNGKPTDGVWFDVFGSSFAAFALRGLFAWTLCLLVAAPLVLFIVIYLLIRKDKLYFLSKDVKVSSEHGEDAVSLGGWRGFFRFPITFIFAAALTVASTLLVAKINPLIAYSSGYAIWIMTASLFYFVLWIGLRGASVVRPSVLQRGYVNLWMFFIGWVVQILAAVAEDRMHLSVLYPTVFLQSGVFLSTLISLLELLALPSRHVYAHGLHDERYERDHTEHDGTSSPTPHDGQDNDADDVHEPTETTPLRAGDGSNNQTSTFGAAYRRSVSRETEADANARKYQPFPGEQSWSGRLPSWLWITQFLLLAPVPLMLQGTLALVFSSALNTTSTEGSSLLLPLLLPGVMSIILILPLAPFIHRVTHHIPTFLLFAFAISLIYNLTAFPFSVNHRFKFYFQQTVDLDKGTDMTTITGLDEYIRPVIASLPSAAGSEPKCVPYTKRDLTACSYDSSGLPPDLVEGKRLDQLITVSVAESSDGRSSGLSLDALETRTCYLEFSKPIFGFSVNGSTRDSRFGSLPEDGLTTIQLWRRAWDGPWNVTIDLKPHHEKNHLDSSAEMGEMDEVPEELERAAEKEQMEVLIRCAWSDANHPSTIPTMHELKRYMPTWATVTKSNVGLVEVWKRYNVPS